MEMEKMSSIVTSKEEDDDVPLPGFRFHPTDQELVSFYLRRKIEKRPISIELIKQVDIYKYDPWDLPKASINVGDKEWYFFCKRGRKYRNSVRPNRVTGSGFWKATGIDKPIYSTGGEGRDCIGLKKSLVFYRGSAGKGTKTDWMMHEFRLPSDHDKSTKHFDAKTIAQEAEVWTLCRIFKRNVSYKKSIPDWKEIAAKRSPVITVSSKTTTTCDMAEYSDCNTQSYISFDAPSHVIRQNNNNNNRPLYNYIEKKPLITGHHVNLTNQLQLVSTQLSSVVSQQQPPSAASSYSGFMNPDVNDILKHGDWDDLRSVVEFAADPLLF